MVTHDNALNKNKAKRPTSITLISIFYWLHVLALMPIAIISIARLVRGNPDENINLDILAPTVILLIVALALALVYALAGWGLWKMEQWARHTAIVTSGLMVLINLATTCSAIINGRISIPSYAFVHGLIFAALFNSNVKNSFTRA